MAICIFIGICIATIFLLLNPAPTLAASQKCLDSTGTKLKSTADACKDELDASTYCIPTFRAASGNTPRRAGEVPAAADLTACTAPGMSYFSHFSNPGQPRLKIPGNILLAKRCRFTCATCCELPEYNCDDAPSAGFDCAANKNYCTTMKDTMSKMCKATCGLCTEIDMSDPNCFDTIANCKKDFEAFGMCSDTRYEADMIKFCAKTCNKCDKLKQQPAADTPANPPPGSPSTGSTNNGDKASNCKDNKNEELCDSTDKAYRELMLKYCAQTCRDYFAKKRKNPPPQKDDCRDASTHCKAWSNNGFCDNTFYSEQVKEDNCAKSCGFC
ncbi:shK domain-like domain-containing protein [Ditylenchus destructor]|uniref:ShK domain-like domain-containing protein n=1 Tax=Ditylenchus destructor TaxID=166010 RepID=A0AAD4MT24_9BILA|nr:shK domain-like domain-containing protein [Ditylenchus destructor]